MKFNAKPIKIKLHTDNSLSKSNPRELLSHAIASQYKRNLCQSFVINGNDRVPFVSIAVSVFVLTTRIIIAGILSGWQPQYPT